MHTNTSEIALQLPREPGLLYPNPDRGHQGARPQDTKVRGLVR